LIRRYLRQRADEITYCYEKQLAVRPSLAGTSTARFVIDQHGRVLQAQMGGMDPAVDACIAETLRRIQFPASQTVYSITYPFTFHAAGM